MKRRASAKCLAVFAGSGGCAVERDDGVSAIIGVDLAVCLSNVSHL